MARVHDLYMTGWRLAEVQLGHAQAHAPRFSARFFQGVQSDCTRVCCAHTHTSSSVPNKPWCQDLAAQEGVEPQLYSDNLKCVSRDPGVLLRAAGFTTGYVRLVGQEPAPGKCVLMSTSRVVRNEMRDWILSREGDR